LHYSLRRQQNISTYISNVHPDVGLINGADRYVQNIPRRIRIDIFEDEDNHVNLAANSKQSLNFNGQYHFNWSPEIEKNIKLFIKFRIAGQKEFLTKLVYAGNN